MPDNLVTTQFPTVKVDGTALNSAIKNTFVELEIESTYNRPDLCTLVFDIDANTDIPSVFDLGKPVEIAFAADGAPATVFKGEVTALDFDGQAERTVFIVQCEDKFHRLFRVDKTRTFLRQSVKDVANKMASDNGLSGDIANLSTRYEYLMQQNVSDAAWLIEQGAKRDVHVRVDDTKLKFKPVGSGGDSTVTVNYGNDLISFSARVTGNAYLKEATVKGWDMMKKEAVEGTSSSYGGRKDSKVANANGNYAAVAALVRTSDSIVAAEANAIADAAMKRANELNLQAEGKCYGNPKLKVDTEVTVAGVNTRFNGKYRLSHVRHRYTLTEGFMTEFASRGASDQSISALVEDAAGSRNRANDRNIFDGVAVGIVTDNKDPDGLGRVKVRFPSLPQDNGNDNASDWMRIAFPGAGGDGKAHHGWYLLPEVNDEVLVIFEQGDARRGYVLGGLHNGQDRPFYDKGKVVGGDGTVNYHAFRTKTGAHLLFDDTNNAEKIELKNKDDKFTLTYSEKDGLKIFEQADKKIVIDGKGNIEITSQSGDLTIEAKSGGINLKATKDIVLDAKGKVSIKAAQDASLEAGTNAKVKGNAGAELSGAMAKVEGSGQTTIKGGMVMIN